MPDKILISLNEDRSAEDQESKTEICEKVGVANFTTRLNYNYKYVRSNQTKTKLFMTKFQNR